MKGARFIIPIFISHAGCPQRCVYCDQSRIARPAPALPAPAEIAAEVERYLELGIRQRRDGRMVQVAFYGGSFTVLPPDTQERLLGAVAPFLKEGSVDSLRLSTRPDYISAEVLEILRAYRVATVELGVQSMADEVLKRSRRGYGRERVTDAVRALKRSGFEVGMQLMIGLPLDSAATLAATVGEVIKLGPHFVRLYPTVVIKGTVLERWFRQGRYSPLSLEEAIILTKESLKRFARARIPVIRIGLQPTPSLEQPGTIVAGPYHPAFRQLVESELLYERAIALLVARRAEARTPPTFRLSPRDISSFYGQGGNNIQRLREASGFNEIRVRPDPHQKRGELSLCA